MSKITPALATRFCAHLRQQGRAVATVNSRKRALRATFNVAVRHLQYLPENPFAEIKQTMRFRRFSLRGKRKARGEWELVCAAFNILTIGRAIEA